MCLYEFKILVVSEKTAARELTDDEIKQLRDFSLKSKGFRRRHGSETILFELC